MNKIIKYLKIILVACFVSSALYAQVGSEIDYKVIFPVNSEWGVYQSDETILPQVKVKMTLGNWFCCPVPSNGAINNVVNLSASTPYFQLAPCGVTGCTSEIITMSEAYSSLSNTWFVTYTKNGKTVNPVGINRSIPDSENWIGICHVIPQLSSLIYAQTSPFISASTLTKLFTSQCAGIDMSQYWNQSSSGDMQILLLLDFSNDSLPEWESVLGETPSDNVSSNVSQENGF